jgi:hypothetical protein
MLRDINMHSWSHKGLILILGEGRAIKDKGMTGMHGLIK